MKQAHEMHMIHLQGVQGAWNPEEHDLDYQIRQIILHITVMHLSWRKTL